MNDYIYGMSPYTLIVIDAQVHFLPVERKRLIKLKSNIIKYIHQAIYDNAGIIFVEMDGYGKTAPSIKKTANGYSKQITIIKDDTSGYENLKNEFFSKDFFDWNKTTFKICGVHTDECVTDTVIDMYQSLDVGTHITVLYDACETFWYKFYETKLDSFTKILNEGITVHSELETLS